MREKAVIFGQTKSLVGVITEPDSPTRETHRLGIIILNAGLLHRVGPNRLHVKLARKMANTGYFVLRFDFSGIGDSSPRDDSLPFEKSSVTETMDAMNYLSSSRDIRRFVLTGICSGANVAFKTACRDPRVVGAIGVNGSYLDGQLLDKLSSYVERSMRGRYYHSRILDSRSWWRLINGKSDLKSIIRYLTVKVRRRLSRSANLPGEANPLLEWRSLIERQVNLLLIYSEGSTALDTYRLLLANHFKRISSFGKLQVEIVEQTDHVFTLLWSQEVLMELIGQWLQRNERNWNDGRFVGSTGTPSII